MATKVITKALAGIQDLLFGEGTVKQYRGKGQYDIDKIRLVYPVNSLEELELLDYFKFPKARLYANGSVEDYVHNGTEYVLVPKYVSICRVKLVVGSASLVTGSKELGVESVSYSGEQLTITTDIPGEHTDFVVRADVITDNAAKYIARYTQTIDNSFVVKFIDMTIGSFVSISDVPYLELMFTVEKV